MTPGKKGIHPFWLKGRLKGHHGFIVAKRALLWASAIYNGFNIGYITYIYIYINKHRLPLDVYRWVYDITR